MIVEEYFAFFRFASDAFVPSCRLQTKKNNNEGHLKNNESRYASKFREMHL